MKEEKNQSSGCSEIPSEVRFNNDPCPEYYTVPHEIKEFKYQIHPKENGVHKVTIEFKIADPFSIKEFSIK